MKTKLLKIVLITLGGIAGLFLIGFAIYIFINYPRKAEPFEIITENPTKNFIIATQRTDFKNALVNILCDSLRESSVNIRVMDVGDLDEVKDAEFDKILIINSFIIRLNKNIDRIITRTNEQEKILLFVTSGGADWLPQSHFKVDAFTSASKKAFIGDLVHMITNWMFNKDNQEWKPNDYLLALKYFPQVDVKTACETIAIEQEQYKSLYPDLVTMINRVGYQYLRLKDIPSALDVFKLNVGLFPDVWNVYDSYGEALLTNGARELAIKNYQKALELNPDSKSANEMLEKLSTE